MSKLVRYRFNANYDDYRPVKWPPPGPYWCTGYACDESYATVIAYLPAGQNLHTWWPEADGIDAEAVDEIVYTSRFPKPVWYKE